MFIRPSSLALCKLIAVGRRRRWVGNLGDEVGRRRFGNTVDENTQKWNFEEDVKADTEAKE